MSDIRIALHRSGSHLLQTHFLMLAEQNRKRLGGRGEEKERRRRDREMLTKINDCNIQSYPAIVIHTDGLREKK